AAAELRQDHRRAHARGAAAGGAAVTVSGNAWTSRTFRHAIAMAPALRCAGIGAPAFHRWARTIVRAPQERRGRIKQRAKPHDAATSRGDGGLGCSCGWPRRHGDAIGWPRAATAMRTARWWTGRGEKQEGGSREGNPLPALGVSAGRVIRFP